jgi:predicted phage terminase large subunit-like protein
MRMHPASKAAANVHIPSELLAELHLLEAAVGGQSILDFIPRVSPLMPGGVPGVPPKHLAKITEALALAEYQPIRVCFSVPPRHGKTEMIIHTIAWWLARHPEHTLAYASYSSDLAGGKSIRARDIAAMAAVRMRSDVARASEWRTISGGGLLAVGTGGPLTGQGANLLIVDDPIKNREEAESKTYRDRVWDWFTSTATTRITPGGSIVVVHTRWHQDDLIGRLRKKKGWTYINLPAIDGDGEALWPEGGWTKEVLAKRREEVGEYDWWSLYMGEPRPRGGRMFEEPGFYEKPSVINAKLIIACDPAATAKTHADYSVIVVGAAWRGEDGLPRVDILDVKRAQVEIPQLVRMLALEQQKWRAPVVVEATGGFKAVPQALRQVMRGLKVIEVQPTADKFTRALPASAAWNAGRIRLPAMVDATGQPRKDLPHWVMSFMEEVEAFTGVSDAHDDQVDALSHLYQAAVDLTAPRGGMTASEASRYLPFG